MKLLFCGGHLTPALAVIEYIQLYAPETELLFVGRTHSQSGQKQRAQESQALHQLGIPFYTFRAPKLDGDGSLIKKVALPFQMLIAVLHAFLLLQKQKPSAIVSFGGYLAVPMAIAGWLQQIPILTHEQTRAAGFANRFIARFATKVAMSYQESAVYFPTTKSVLTGNPIRQSILHETPSQPQWWSFLESGQISRPILYITGGNQGSARINSVVAATLPKLTQHWNIIHQCGNATAQHNYRRELYQVQTKLPPAQQQRYYVKEWFDGNEVNWIMRHALGALSRSGANTVNELQTLSLPSILIPLPFSHANEQQLNAEFLVESGGALLLPQNELTAASLLDMLTDFQKKAPMMRQNLLNQKKEQDASQAIWQILKHIART